MNDTTDAGSREVVETSGKIRMSDIAMDERGITIANLGQAKAFSLAMAEGDIGIPKHLRGNWGACMAIIEDARRFGMPAYALARESYMVKDQLAYQAKVIHAVVLKSLKPELKRRPRFQYTGEGKDLQLTIVFELLDGDVIEHQSPKLGEITPQNSPLWKSDPRQQLGYYTARSAARLHFPEFMLGLYTDEERMVTIEHEPRTSGVGKRLTAKSEGPSHAENAKTAVEASRTVPEETSGVGGSQVAAEEKNAPAAAPAAPEASPTDEQDYKPPYGPNEEAFTLTEDERRLLYGLSEMLAVVTAEKELEAVTEQWATHANSLNYAVVQIGNARIVKKREAIAVKKKRK